VNHLILAVSLCLLLIAAYSARAQPFDDPELEQIRLLHELDPFSLEVWTKYLALQEQLIQKAMTERPAIVDEANKKFENLAVTVEDMKRRLPSAAEQGLSGETVTGSLPMDQPRESPGTLRGGELAQLEASVEHWISAALAANELELRASRFELREAATIIPPLITIAGEREHKQEIVAKIVVIIADVLKELARREKEQRRLDQNKGKADKLEPSAGYGSWRDLARSAE
jgi:hypothetical protein